MTLPDIFITSRLRCTHCALPFCCSTSHASHSLFILSIFPSLLFSSLLFFLQSLLSSFLFSSLLFWVSSPHHGRLFREPISSHDVFTLLVSSLPRSIHPAFLWSNRQHNRSCPHSKDQQLFNKSSFCSVVLVFSIVLCELLLPISVRAPLFYFLLSHNYAERHI